MSCGCTGCWLGKIWRKRRLERRKFSPKGQLICQMSLLSGLSMESSTHPQAAGNRHHAMATKAHSGRREAGDTQNQCRNGKARQEG